MKPHYNSLLSFQGNSRYSPSVFHSILYLISPCDFCSSFFQLIIQRPHTPSFTHYFQGYSLSYITLRRPSSINDSVAQLSILIKPGATAFPFASISFFADAFDRSPIKAIVSAFNSNICLCKVRRHCHHRSFRYE